MRKKNKSVLKQDESLYFGELDCVPGCCGVGVVHGLWIEEDGDIDRDDDRDYAFMWSECSKVSDYIKDSEYSLLVATTTDETPNCIRQGYALKELGWKCVAKSPSAEANHNIFTWMYNCEPKSRRVRFSTIKYVPRKLNK